MDTCTFNVLSLCSGVGGLELGLRLAVPTARTICFVEREAYCCEVLAERMEDKCLDEAPIWTDLRTFDGKPWCGIVDCVTAGFPCQPVSRAGRRQREQHDHWLWDDVLRVVVECESDFVFIENVDALRANGGQKVANDLTSCGYAVAWDLFSARAVGASHTRPRLYLLATKRLCLDDTLCGRYRTKKKEICPRRQAPFPPSPRVLSEDVKLRAIWPEPGIQGSFDGVPDRVDRLRACGNVVLPTVAAHAWTTLVGRLKELFRRM